MLEHRVPGFPYSKDERLKLDKHLSMLLYAKWNRRAA